MSMTGTLTRVSHQTFERLIEDPAQVLRLISPKLAKTMESYGGPYAYRQPPIAFEEAEGAQLDLYKNWHVLHFALTGSAQGTGEVIGFICDDDLPKVGDLDVGYGPARYLEPDAVKQLKTVLTSLRRTDLKRRFDPGRMDALEIYPSHWGRDDDDGIFADALSAFDDLKRFVKDTSRIGFGILVAIQ